LSHLSTKNEMEEIWAKVRHLGDGGLYERGISVLVFTIDIVAIKNIEDGVIPRGRGCNDPNINPHN